MARLRDRMLSNTILQPSLYENDVNGHVVVAMTSEFVLIDAVCIVEWLFVQCSIYLMMFWIHTPAFGRFKHLFKYRLIFLILVLFTRFIYSICTQLWLKSIWQAFFFHNEWYKSGSIIHTWHAACYLPFAWGRHRWRTDSWQIAEVHQGCSKALHSVAFEVPNSSAWSWQCRDQFWHRALPEEVSCTANNVFRLITYLHDSETLIDQVKALPSYVG